MSFTLLYFTAFGLDLLVGDPPAAPHPVRLIGRLCAGFERLYRTLFDNERLGGAVTVLSVIVCTLAPLLVLLAGTYALAPWLANGIALVLLASSIACRDLIRHSRRVYRALVHNGDIQKARKEVAMIVGRDTAQLDRQGICRACVETVAENLVDGVVSPLFFGVLVSLLPGANLFSSLALAALGAYLYKAVNTMDSMFGYKNEQYRDFGMAAAKLDDCVNYLPARLSGLLLVASAFVLRLDYRGAWRIFVRDRRKHASPNAGHPEAAVSGALGIQLGGPNYYFGKQVAKPTIGDAEKEIDSNHILAVNALMLSASAMFVLLSAAGRYIVLGEW